MSALTRLLIFLRLKPAPWPEVELPKATMPLVTPRGHFVKLDKVRGAPRLVPKPAPWPPAPGQQDQWPPRSGSVASVYGIEHPETDHDHT